MRTILPHTENLALREVARDIPPQEVGSARIQGLIAEMKALLAKEEYGVALAAPQVGEPLNLFIVSGRALARGTRNAPDLPAQAGEPLRGVRDEQSDVSPDNAGEIVPDQVYINPVMTKMSRGRKDKHEGCLSIRGYWGMVPRAEKATVRALDENGAPFTRGASGFLAHVFQHEMDHLAGILYTDKATEVHEEEPEDEDATAERTGERRSIPPSV
jgi:peptide deformylase